MRSPITIDQRADGHPAGWKWVPITDVAELATGHTPDRARPEYWNGGIPWISLTEIRKFDGRYATATDLQVSDEGIRNSSAVVLPAGTVCFSRTASIGFVTIMGAPMATSQDFVNWICGDDLDPRYLMHALRCSRSDLLSLSTGSTHKTIYVRVAEKFRILLPPVSEQRRIADVLDRADAVRAKRRLALRALAQLGSSAFLEIFGDPARNPMGWPVMPLAELATKFSDGPFGSNLKTAHYTDQGVRVIRLQNIGVGEFDDRDRAFISKSHFERLAKHECLPGDVIVGTMGDPNLRACVQPSWLTVAVNKADCVQIRPDERVAKAEYLCGLLNEPATERMAQDRIVGQTRLRISMGRLRTLEVPVPPVAAQVRYATLMTQLRRVTAAQVRNLAQLDALDASLQHRAFRGEL